MSKQNQIVITPKSFNDIVKDIKVIKQYDTHQKLEVTLLDIENCEKNEVCLKYMIYGEVAAVYWLNYETSMETISRMLFVGIDRFLNLHRDAPLRNKRICFYRGKIRIENGVRVLIKNRIKQINTEELFVEIAGRINDGCVVTIIDETTNE